MFKSVLAWSHYFSSSLSGHLVQIDLLFFLLGTFAVFSLKLHLRNLFLQGLVYHAQVKLIHTIKLDL